MATHSGILAGKFHGQRSLAGYSPWDQKELDTAEQHIHTVPCIFLHRIMGITFLYFFVSCFRCVCLHHQAVNSVTAGFCLVLFTITFPEASFVAILGSGRSPGEENDNPRHYSCLENPMDRGAWQATVHGVARVGYDLATKPPPCMASVLTTINCIIFIFNRLYFQNNFRFLAKLNRKYCVPYTL